MGKRVVNYILTNKMQYLFQKKWFNDMQTIMQRFIYNLRRFIYSYAKFYIQFCDIIYIILRRLI